MSAVEILLAEPLARQIGWGLLHFVWQGAAAAVVLGVLLLILRRRSAQSRYLAGCCVMLAMAAAFVTTVCLSKAAIPVAPAPTAAITKLLPPIPETMNPDPETPGTPFPSEVIEIQSEIRNPHSAIIAPLAPPLSARIEPWLGWLVLGWLLGVAVLSLRLLGGWVRVQWLRRRLVRPVAAALEELLAEVAGRLRISLPVKLLESALTEVPTAIGWLRPVILLPASALTGLAPKQLQALLAHELAHIRRHDYLVNLVQSLVETLLFYHPAVWWVSHRIRQERENCCDDLAVGVCGDRATYARALADMEQLRATPARLAAAAAGGSLLARIRRIAGAATPPSSRSSGWAAGIAAIGILLAIAAGLGLSGSGAETIAPAVTQPKAESLQPPAKSDVLTTRPADQAAVEAAWSSAPVVSGVAEYVDGRPVVGATVWLVKTKYPDDVSVLATTTTDPNGRFAFLAPPSDVVFARPGGLPRVIVRDAQHRLGWKHPFSPAEANNLQIRMHDITECTVRVQDASGLPIAGATVKPLFLTSQRLANQGDIRFIPEFAGEFEAVTGPDGTFVLRCLPVEARFYARVSAPGFGAPTIGWMPTESLTIRLVPAGSVSGALAGNVKAADLSGAKVMLRRVWNRPERGSPELVLLYDEVACPDAGGAFRFEMVYPGDYKVIPLFENTVPFYAGPTDSFKVLPAGQTAGVSVRLHSAVALRGRAVDKDTGLGVENVGLRIQWKGASRQLPPLTNVFTDKDGRFLVYIRPGTVSVTVASSPEAYLPPFPTLYPSTLPDKYVTWLEATQDIECPEIRLERAVTVQGLVHDEAGNAVSGAEVRALSPNYLPWEIPVLLTDNAGRFAIPKTYHDDPLPVLARTATAVTAGSTIVIPDDLTGPLKLVLCEKNAFRLRGKVIGDGGGPISRAWVAIHWNIAFASKRAPDGGGGLGYQLDKIYTDANGLFESAALWPGFEYRIGAQAEGYEAAKSPEVKGQAGQTHDVGTITLRKTQPVPTVTSSPAATQPAARAAVEKILGKPPI